MKEYIAIYSSKGTYHSLLTNLNHAIFDILFFNFLLILEQKIDRNMNDFFSLELAVQNINILKDLAIIVK